LVSFQNDDDDDDDDEDDDDDDDDDETETYETDDTPVLTEEEIAQLQEEDVDTEPYTCEEKNGVTDTRGEVAQRRSSWRGT